MKECESSSLENLNKIKTLQTSLDESTKTTATAKQELENYSATLNQGIIMVLG